MDATLAPYVARWLRARLAPDPLPPGTAYPLEATVLFADVVGFTPLTGAMAQGGLEGVEALGHILNTVFGTLVDTLYSFGGDVVKFSGDALLAFWPLTEDAPARAVVAAQALQAVMQRFDRVSTPLGPQSLAMRVGLALGPVTLLVVGSAERRYFLCAGPAVSLAAAAEARAPERGVLLHSRLREHLGSAATCDELGVLRALHTHIAPVRPPVLPPPPAERLVPFVPPTLANRILAGQRTFLADFRHGVVPMFVAFVASTPAAIQSYTRQVLDIVDAYGGHLSEVEAGDKGNLLVILFGAPLTHGDNGARAAACALDLAALPATEGIGATTGSLFTGVVGSDHRRQYATFGAEMNLAIRLMQHARQHADHATILLDDPTHRIAGDRFTYGERRVIRVKGRADPVATWSLLGRTRRWGEWFDRWIDGETIVGRRDALAHITDVISHVRAGAGQVLTLVGEAGMGKSRLIGEILLRWTAQQHAVHLGSGEATTRRTPYHAWGELLIDFFDLRGDLEDVARVTSALAATEPDLIPRLPLLSGMLGLDLPDNAATRHLDAERRQQATHALVVELIRHRAARSPLLLILEDAHWLDKQSWQLTLAVARATRDVPVLICIAHRPWEEQPTSTHVTLTWLEHHSTVCLDALSQPESLKLARQHLGAEFLPPPLADLVLDKAQGHPFFIEEILNALRDVGLIRVQGREVELVGSLADLALPDTVQGVVQARLDRLDSDTRLTLKVAAVIGRTFHARVLHAVHPMPDGNGALRDQLETLAQRDITRMVEYPSRKVEQHELNVAYSFKHAITHDVAYGSLSFAQRRSLHHALAQWYEVARKEDGEDAALAGGSLPQLVHHYHHAGIVERERHYARLAGEQAAAQFANAEALNYLSRALDLTSPDDVAERFALLLAREQVYGYQGARAAQGDDLHTLSALVEKLDDPASRIEVTLRCAAYANVTEQHDRAIALARQAIKDAPANKANSARIQARGYVIWGRALWQKGQLIEAWGQLETAFTLARLAGLRRVEADTLYNLGEIGKMQGDQVKARFYFAQALEIFQAIGDQQGSKIAQQSLQAYLAQENDSR